MSKTRREFLQSSVALTMGLMGGALAARTALAAEPQGSLAPSAGPTGGIGEIQVPKIKFGNAEIGRLVLGCNPINGGAHFNSEYSSMMKEWFTPDRACALMYRATSFGINAFQYSNAGRCPEDWERFKAEGGKMYLIAGDSTDRDPATVVANLKPHAFHRQGEVVDVALRNGTMKSVKEWCKHVRDTGVMVGVATHKPEVIALVEEQGWDVDYFAGCVYNRTRSDEEWRKVLGGELPEMTREIYIQSDPAGMYKVMRQTPKPCFAFKILATGRIVEGGIAQAFRTAFTSIKPIDGVFVGMFPRDKDQVKENAEIVNGILAGA